MITNEVARALEVVRQHLQARRESDDPMGFLYRVGQPLGDVGVEVPEHYAELLKISDGGKVGSFQYRNHQELAGRDNYLEMSPAALGDNDLSSFYQVGVYVDVPVMLRRDDGSVWSFPDFSGYWWMDQVIERVAFGLDEYLRAWVFDQSMAITHGESGWLEILSRTGTELP